MLCRCAEEIIILVFDLAPAGHHLSISGTSGIHIIRMPLIFQPSGTHIAVRAKEIPLLTNGDPAGHQFVLPVISPLLTVSNPSCFTFVCPSVITIALDINAVRPKILVIDPSIFHKRSVGSKIHLFTVVFHPFFFLQNISFIEIINLSVNLLPSRQGMPFFIKVVRLSIDGKPLTFQAAGTVTVRIAKFSGCGCPESGSFICLQQNPFF